MATFESKCPLCGKGFQAEEEWIGQTGECPECGKEIKIQAPENIATSQPQPPVRSAFPFGDLKVIKMYKGMNKIARRTLLFGLVLFPLSIATLSLGASLIETIISAIGYLVLFAGASFLGRSFRVGLIFAGGLYLLIIGIVAYVNINKTIEDSRSAEKARRYSEEQEAIKYGVPVEDYRKMSSKERASVEEAFTLKKEAVKYGVPLEEYKKIPWNERLKIAKAYENKMEAEAKIEEQIRKDKEEAFYKTPEGIAKKKEEELEAKKARWAAEDARIKAKVAQSHKDFDNKLRLEAMIREFEKLNGRAPDGKELLKIIEHIEKNPR
ncbi:MAG TPA: hypothetical protein DET40_10070 [Lentisphaeria bacterium]|nr:MAG: hypothetical protein A2X45_08855 [Lentisphaerae bacterium GWF2_50_93]HCE43881.1 hypothetical protein [Lentisphaeria bacterium]